MIKITAVFWIALLAIAGGTVMRVSYQVRHVEEHLSQLGRDIHREQDALRILTAEWNSLNDPQRIDSLAKRYLPLQPTPIQRVVALDDIPFKPTAAQLAALAAKPAGKGAAKTAAALALRTVGSTRAALPAPVAPSSASRAGLLQVRAERPE